MHVLHDVASPPASSAPMLVPMNGGILARLARSLADRYDVERELGAGGMAAPKAAGGRPYWLERDVVMSASFDAEGARVTSEPAPVVSGVRGDLLGAADFDVADDGTVVFVAGADPSIGPLAWLDRQGRVDTLPVPPIAENVE